MILYDCTIYNYMTYTYDHVHILSFFPGKKQKIGQSEIACMEFLQSFKSKYSKEATAGKLVAPLASDRANTATTLLQCPKFTGLV